MVKYFVLAFLLVMGKAIGGVPQSEQPQRIIEVAGVGNILSVPDRFSFSVTIEQRGKVASDLNKALVEKTQHVVQALLKIGVNKKSIQSLQVQFNPWIEYTGNAKEQKGFILTRQIKLTVDTLEQYEQAIDAILSLGVNNINQFSFTDSQANKNYQQALKEALLDAKQRASEMASVLGLKISKVMSISELSSGTGAPSMLQSSRLRAAESYQPGEMSTQASVKVIFTLQDE